MRKQIFNVRIQFIILIADILYNILMQSWVKEIFRTLRHGMLYRQFYIYGLVNETKTQRIGSNQRTLGVSITKYENLELYWSFDSNIGSKTLK